MANKILGMSPVVAVLVAIGIYLVATGNIPGMGDEPVITETPSIAGTCDSTTTPAISFIATEKYNAATTPTGYTVVYKLGTQVGLSQVATSTAISASPGDVIEYLVNATGYYTVHGTMTVPCEEVTQINVEMADFDTSTTFSYFNSDDNNANSDTNPLDITTSEKGEFVKLTTSTTWEDSVQDAFLYCTYNNTAFEKPTSDLGSHAVPDFVASAANVKNVGFDLGTLTVGTGVSTDVEGMRINLPAEDDQNPTLASNITCYINDYDWFVGTDGKFKYDYQNDLDAEVGQTAPSNFIIYID